MVKLLSIDPLDGKLCDVGAHHVRFGSKNRAAFEFLQMNHIIALGHESSCSWKQ